MPAMAKVETIAGLRTFLAGGTDRNGGGDGPLVCLLHGYGANGEDLAGLWRVLDVPDGTRFAFPEAPISLAAMFGMPSYAWWHIDVERFMHAAQTGIGMNALFDEEPDGLPAAREKVQTWLTTLGQRLGAPRRRTVLGGFSQGAMLSADVALHLQGEDEGLAGLALLSGALINRRGWQPLLASAVSAPRFQSHGTRDDILPFAAAEALDQFLAPRFPGALRRFNGRHEIPTDVIDDLGGFLSRVLG